MVRGLEAVLDAPDFKNLKQDGRDPRRGFLSSSPATERKFSDQLGLKAGDMCSSSRRGLLCSRCLRRINTDAYDCHGEMSECSAAKRIQRDIYQSTTPSFQYSLYFHSIIRKCTA